MPDMDDAYELRALRQRVTELEREVGVLGIRGAIFDIAADAIMITDRNNRIVAVNPAFTEITGYTPEEAVGQGPRILRSGRHDDAFYRAMWHAIGTSGRWAGEIWNRRKNGEVYPEWLSIGTVTDDGGTIQDYVAVFSDITKRKEAEAEIRHRASHDSLTGLPNRILLMDRVNGALARARRNGTVAAVLFVDIDDFKGVNDALGHEAGDQLLCKVAKRLVGSVRETDTVARFGGDEFTVVLTDMDDTAAVESLAKKMVATLSQPYILKGRWARASASIGVAIHPGDGATADELLRCADAAMYAAKHRGRSAFAFANTPPGTKRRPPVGSTANGGGGASARRRAARRRRAGPHAS